MTQLALLEPLTTVVLDGMGALRGTGALRGMGVVRGMRALRGVEGVRKMGVVLVPLSRRIRL